VPEFLCPMTKLMPASFVCAGEQDHVSHGSDGTSGVFCYLHQSPNSRMEPPRQSEQGNNSVEVHAPTG
jgi:hypothetical protein